MFFDKHKAGSILLIILAIVGLIGGMYLVAHRSNQRNPAPPSVSESASPASSGSAAHNPNVGEIPDLKSRQNNVYDKPFEKIDPDKMSPSTLTEDEIEKSVKKVLDGLMVLDANAIKRVSIQTTNGEYNPFRIMLNAATSDEVMKQVFLNASTLTSYEIKDITCEATRFEVKLKVNSPYVMHTAMSLAGEAYTGDFVPSVYTVPFKSYGAAEEMAQVDMSVLPMNTDIVTLVGIIHDDVPIIYYPTSFAYGNRIPQYAFLWGGFIFQGTENGDLLLESSLQGKQEVDRSAFLETGGDVRFLEFLESFLTAVKTSTPESIKKHEFDGYAVRDQTEFTRSYPSLAPSFEKYPTLERDMQNRLNTFEYTLQYYEGHTEEGMYPWDYSAAITYSVEDAATGGRTYRTEYMLFQNFGAQNGNTNADTVVDLASRIWMTAFGGDNLDALARLRELGVEDAYA